MGWRVGGAKDDFTALGPSFRGIGGARTELGEGSGRSQLDGDGGRPDVSRLRCLMNQCGALDEAFGMTHIQDGDPACR